MAEAKPLDQSGPSSALQWLANGWRSLRDKALSALTYFAPEEAQAETSQRWGVLATDVTEHKDEVRVELELPGLEKADLHVEVHKDRLLISGEKRVSSTRHVGSLVVTERAFGRFQRVIPTPCDVRSEGTTAKYENGVLTVEMPKDRSSRGRAIPISRS